MIKLIDLIKEDNFFGLKVGDEVKFKDNSDRSVAIIKYGVNPNTTFKIVALHHGHPEVPDPNTHATLVDDRGKKVEEKVYTGYLKKVDEMSEATFTDKYDDNPKLKGKQTKLPDELQAQLVKEGDHEVAMAMASLKSIIKSSVTLLNKLGNEERNIPGWIQDHITNAENYIDQAAQGFHELNHNEMNEQLKRLQELANVKEAFSNRDESVYQDFIKLDGESKLKFFGKIRDWYKTASDPAVKAGLPKQKIVGAINSFMDEYGSYVKKGEDEGDKYDFS